MRGLVRGYVGSVALMACALSGARADGPGATIVGRAVFEGTPMKAPAIQLTTDPVCQHAHSGPLLAESLIVGADGGLDNVFVYVKHGLENQTFPPASAPVQIEQKGCQYIPHVFGIRTGQTLEIVNSDTTLHNIHAMPQNNTPFNVGQPRPMHSTKVFSSPEVMVPVRCDVHSWMSAYVGVLDHPYFAVSGPDGSFSLPPLPPGEYVLEAWHERLGTRTTTVKIGANEKRAVTFSFKAQS
jgi:hypothetical protein